MDHIMIMTVTSNGLSLLLGVAMGRNAPGWVIASLMLMCMISTSYLGTLIRALSQAVGQ